MRQKPLRKTERLRRVLLLYFALRSYFGKAIPDKRQAGEFFGFFSIFSKFESVLGTFLMSTVITLTNNINLGVVSILLTFIIGGTLMLFVPDDKNLEQAKAITE